MIFTKTRFTVSGILDSSKDDFEDADEVYEAIGEVLHEVEQKSENEVRLVNFCIVPCSLIMALIDEVIPS